MCGLLLGRESARAGLRCYALIQAAANASAPPKRPLNPRGGARTGPATSRSRSPEIGKRRANHFGRAREAVTPAPLLSNKGTHVGQLAVGTREGRCEARVCSARGCEASICTLLHWRHLCESADCEAYGFGARLKSCAHAFESCRLDKARCRSSKASGATAPVEATKAAASARCSMDCS